MAWIEVHQALPSHRKTLALSDALGIEPAQVVGHLVCLWLWSLDNSPTGDLGEVSNRTIARAAGWKKDADAFADSLRSAGFLDGTQIHDWPDYAGRLVEKREANRRRMRAARAARDEQHVDSTNDERAENVQRTTDARAGATVPNPTVPLNPVVPTGQPKSKAKPKHEPLTDEQRERIVEEYTPKLGAEVVAAEIEAAMNHSARFKAISEALYLRTWLRRVQPRQLSAFAPRTNGYAVSERIGPKVILDD